MYFIEQRVFLVLEYHRRKHSLTATRHSFQKRFNLPKGHDAKTIHKLFFKLQRTFSVADYLVRNFSRNKTAFTPENVATVSGMIQQHPRKSVQKLSAETGLKRSTTQKKLRNSLHMFSFKIQAHNAISVRALRQMADFADKKHTIIDNEGFDVNCIWFTNEAHFHRNEFVNK